MLKVERRKKRPLAQVRHSAAQRQLAFSIPFELGYRSKAEAPQSFIQVAALKGLSQVIALSFTVESSTTLSTADVEGGTRESSRGEVKPGIDLKLLKTPKVWIHKGLPRLKGVGNIEAVKLIPVLCPGASMDSHQSD